MLTTFGKWWAWLVARWPFDRRDALAATGATSLVHGIALLSVPSAWITAGALMLLIWSAPWLSMRKKKW